MLKRTAELSATIALVKAGRLKPFLKKSECYRLYGRKTVDNWLLRGLVVVRKDGDHSAAWRISRTEIMTVAIASELEARPEQTGHLGLRQTGASS